MLKSGPKRQGELIEYPYKILPFDISRNPSLQRPDAELRWHILEFLRTEALLRSPKLWQLYKEEASDDELKVRFCIQSGWGILNGEHHSLLARMGPLKRPTVAEGIVDLKDLYALNPRKWMTKQNLATDDSRYACLRIDTAYPPGRLIPHLRNFLKQHHKSTSAMKPDSTTIGSIRFTSFPVHPDKMPPRFSLSVWSIYFQCFDLFKCEGRSAGDISWKLYRERSDAKSLKKVEQGVKRVEQLIDIAERGPHHWPPAAKFLK